jgi:hypothetical protein
MNTSKELLKEANITPKLRLGEKTDKGVKSTGPHRVKIMKDKLDKGTDHEGKEIDVVKYLVEENGQHKFYEVEKLGKNGELHYLVQRLAEVPEGSEVILEMKKRGVKNYIEVTTLNTPAEVEMDDYGSIEELEEDLNQ